MIQNPLISSKYMPKPKTIDDYSINLLINELNNITQKYPISNPAVARTRKGKYGEAVLKCAVNNYLWSKRTNDYDLMYDYPPGIQNGIDVRFEVDNIVVYIEAKNWDAYPIHDSTFNSEILDRFTNHVKEKNALKAFLINEKSISLSWIWDLCFGYDLYMIPVKSLITPSIINNKQIIKERVTSLFWDIDNIMKEDSRYNPNLYYPVFSQLNDRSRIKRKEAVRIALKSKIPLDQIEDNLGYNRHSLYRIRRDLREAGEMK